MAKSAPGGIHLTSAPLVEIDGDRATVEQSFLFVDQVTPESRIGWYDDRLLRTPSGWRFEVRSSTFLTADGASDQP
jgi:hypothetical protein